MQEGIEPTISTIPSGCTNEIVLGDRPSTVSGDQTWHTISFSSECGWIPVSRCTPYSPGCREQNPSFDSVLIHIIFTTIPPNSSLFWHKVSILILIPSEVYKFVATEWCTQSDTSSFTLSEWLVPTLWSLRLISCPVTSAVYVWTLRFLLVPLSRTHPHQNSVGD